MRRLATLSLLLVCACASTARGQSARPPSAHRTYIVVGFSEQIASHEISTSETFPQFSETGTLTGTVTAPKAPRFDIGGGARVARHLRVGVLVSVLSHAGVATGTFTIPDPFLFDTPHSASASEPAKRREIAVHFQLSVPVVDRPDWQFVLAGGPTYTQIQQQLLTDAIEESFTFPFQAIQLTPGAATATGHGFGGHVEASVVRAITPKAGVYGDVLFSSTRATVTDDRGSAKVDTGGVAVGVGVRFHF